MRKPRIPANESERLADLRSYEILDTVPEEAYDGLTALAAEICETPIALVSLVETDRQWFKSRVGLDAEQTDRAVSFCGHAVADDATLVVPDATDDERFSDNPLVAGDPRIRFYAGALIRSHRGLNLGTLCVIDTRPRDLSESQVRHLETLARQVEAQLELRRQEIDIRNLQQLHAATGRIDMTYDERIAAILEAGTHGLDLAEAYVSRIRGEQYEVRYRYGPAGGPEAGDVLPLKETYCALTTDAGETTSLQNAATACPGHPAAARFGGGSYVGTPIVIDGVFRGTLCFVGREPRGRRISTRERNLVGLYAQRVSLEAARQREHKRLLEQKLLLEQKNQQLNEANDELNQFAYVVSHDLRAPLRAISNLSRWIEEDADGELTDAVTEHLGLLRSRVSRMDSLINGILEYSRAGRAHALEDVDLQELFAEVRDAIDPPAPFRIEAEPGLPSLRGDRTQLFQVFSNLVGNAAKYHDREDGRVTVTAAEEDDAWIITVADDGPGIDPRYQEKVFQIFQTLQPRDERESTGVGLSIVRKIVDRAGGRVWIESDGERGTAVHVRWPKHVAPVSQEESSSPQHAEEGGER